ncbi:heme binding [Apophysomyces sp. BC1015]|nr:heme binding [Apophysomyces sp. BC1015]
MAAEQKKVILETSMGQVEIELYWDHAPKTCQNFYELARRGYYNGISFHRVIADFMIQGKRSIRFFEVLIAEMNNL